MKSILIAFFSATLAAGAAENIALGKPYTFNRPPNYNLCTDPGDKTDLTDGIYTKKGSFWSQKSTVGWSLGWCGIGERTVTVDLGRDEPISGFSWNLAAGRAGVAWPELVFVYVSQDGNAWQFVGDLYAQSKKENGAPPEDGYGVYRAHSSQMPCHGRYVTFLVTGGGYMFVDEIEIYKGPQSNMMVKLDGDPVSKVIDHYGQYRARRLVLVDMAKVSARAASVTEKAWPDVEKSVYLFNAKVARAKGFREPFLWACERWDNVDITGLVPPAGAMDEPVGVRMMRGETRSAAVNLSNPTDSDMKFMVSVEGLPKEANVDCREVLFTCTKAGRRVSGALRPGEGSSVSFTVPAGTVKQAWISFVKPTVAAGTYGGRIVATSGGFSARKELRLVVSPVSFPKRPRLHVGGWDYVEGGNTYFRSPGNLAGKMREMKAMFVDTPWASGRLIPSGAKFGPDGALLNAESLNYKMWDEWIALWGDDARQFGVFLSGDSGFRGEKIGTPRFNRMVGDFMRAWYDHAAKSGLKGRTVYMQPIDEPRTDEMDRNVIAWAKAIRSRGTGFKVYVDVDRKAAEKTFPEVYDLADVTCPKSLNIWLGSSEDFYRQIAKRPGKDLWLYSCSGPSRTFDPILYYRAQAWRAWSLGAKGTFFWAFGCGGGIGDSWRPFEQPSTEYSPFFVSQDDAMAAKQSEAVKESVEDYEYLAMLADRVAALKKAGRDMSAYEKLLAEAPERVVGDAEFTASHGRKDNDPRYDWDFPNSRGTADKVRLEVLDALERLSR